MHQSTSRRARRLRALLAATGLAAAATMMAMNAAEAATARYEAESAPAVCDGTIDANHTGFSGSGFCNSTNAVGASSSFTTPHQTNLRIPTLMHDVQYRVAIAWQNTAYNQPPHPSFHIGSEVASYPWPDVRTP